MTIHKHSLIYSIRVLSRWAAWYRRRAQDLQSEDLDLDHDSLVSYILCEQCDLRNLSVHAHGGGKHALRGLLGGSNEAVQKVCKSYNVM